LNDIPLNMTSSSPGAITAEEVVSLKAASDRPGPGAGRPLDLSVGGRSRRASWSRSKEISAFGVLSLTLAFSPR